MYKDLYDIPRASNWTDVEKIEAGWSIDSKYKVKCFDGTHYLVRLSPIKYHDIKLQEFNILSGVQNKNISHPIECGRCNSNKSTYMIFSWIEGVEADRILSDLPAIQQYNLGLQSGHLLKEIHTLKIPESNQSWSSKYSKKIERNITRYLNCGHRVEGFSEIIKYVTANKNLLTGRKQTAQHGDYHIGNMIITPQNEIGVIDFNRFDIGDPWEEFNRITWSSSASKYFATGQVHGYFDKDFTMLEEFFKLLALYIGSNQLSSIPWALDYGDEEVATMIVEAKKVLKSYDYYKTYIPDWYIGGPENVRRRLAESVV
jgi:aminoglycoside phosphotransferase (APT) family kinase protein